MESLLLSFIVFVHVSLSVRERVICIFSFQSRVFGVFPLGTSRDERQDVSVVKEIFFL